MLQAETAVRKESPEQVRDILVSMKGIVKQYQVGGETSTVLKGIDLTVRKGEFLAILGPSGSGKSTLMNIIGCLDVPTEGEYLLSGIQISDQDEKHGIQSQAAGKGVGSIAVLFDNLKHFFPGGRAHLIASV